MTPEPLFPAYPLAPRTLAEHIAWHLRIAQGIPLSLFQDMCEPGLFKRPELAEVVFGKRTCPRAGEVSLEAANTLYRVLVSLEAAREKFSGDGSRAAKWLSSPHPGFRGRTPLSLLSTSMGLEYVRTAIQRG